MSKIKNLFYQNKIPVSIFISALIITLAILVFAVLNNSKQNKSNILENLMNQDKYFAGLPFKNNEYILGNTKNDITVLVYSDFECPFCKKLQEEAIKKLQDEYKLKDNYSQGRIGIVYRHFAQSYHDKAEKEINASLCARELYGQNTYIHFINRLYEITPANNGLDLALLPDIANYAINFSKNKKEKVKTDFNLNEFNKCLNNKTYNQEFLDDYQDAENVGLDGTPYIIILYKDENKNLIIHKESGARDLKYFKVIIDKLLKI